MQRSNTNPPDASLSPDEVVGQTLEDILVSTEPLVGDELPGVGRPRYCDVVLLLGGGVRCWLLGDQLEIWSSSASLAPLNPSHFGIEPNTSFRGCRVTGVSSDDEGDLIFELDDAATLQVVTDHGTQILLAPKR